MPVADTTRPPIEEYKALAERAREMVSNLNKPRGTKGAREWEMSIPARPDHDPDLIICAALDAADDIGEYARRLEAALSKSVCGTCFGSKLVRRFVMNVNGVDEERIGPASRSDADREACPACAGSGKVAP